MHETIKERLKLKLEEDALTVTVVMSNRKVPWYVTTTRNGHSYDMPVWVKPVLCGWDRVGTSISNLGDFYWDFDIKNITVSHTDHT